MGLSGQTVPDTPEELLHAPVSHTPTRLENVFAPVYACKNLRGWPDQNLRVIQGAEGPCWGLFATSAAPLIPLDLPAELHNTLGPFKQAINK